MVTLVAHTGVGKPVLVIPWTVMQELDSLKVLIIILTIISYDPYHTDSDGHHCCKVS